jgi:hypothetical protein
MRDGATFWVCLGKGENGFKSTMGHPSPRGTRLQEVGQWFGPQAPDQTLLVRTSVNH